MGCKMYRTIVEAILAHAVEEPDKLAVGFKKHQLTYRILTKQVKAFAYRLQTIYGIKKGDLIMISAVSKQDYVVAWLAIQFLGAVSVPLDKTAKDTNILEIYEFIAPQLLLTDRTLNSWQQQNMNKASLKELYSESVKAAEFKEGEKLIYQIPDMESVAEILFTTGTTGKPKGAMLTYSNIYASAHNTWNGIGMKSSDKVLLPLPLNHSVGMRVLRTALYIGASIVIQNGFTFAKELEVNISEYKCTGLVSVPASIEVVYRQMQDQFATVMGKLRYIEIGAGSLSYDMKKKLVKELPDTFIYNTWGSTETGGAIFLNVSINPDKLTSIGKPVDGVELKVVDKKGNAIKAHNIDTAGRMALRGKMQMKGYFHLPKQTAETLVDGWLYTNDIVYTDEDGYVYMLGRADDIINVGGEKVSPVEVENIAAEFEEIRECACIGADDPEGILGRVPILYVVLEGTEFHKEELVKFLADRMERYKLPQQYVLIQKLPRNRMNKLNRTELYRLWKENGAEEMMNDTVQTILNRRSIREFTEQNIPKAYLEMIAQCGIYAPSGHNLQTWRFTVIQDQEQISNLKETTARVAKEKKVYFYGFQNPNAVILVSNDRKNKNAIQDSACAAENMMLAAQSYGIGSVWQNTLHQISDEPEIRELLQKYAVPDSHIVWAAVLMGYPAKQGKLLAKKMDTVRWFPAGQ